MADTEEKGKDKRFFKRISKTKGYELLSAFIKSAAVGMLFAVFCFGYDVYHDNEQDKQLQASVDKLAKIEQSLSTRYLGIFPEYISEITLLFENLEPSDTVIIFEDVLYYGIKSRPKEFCAMNDKLFEHAMHGGSITVVHYNVERSGVKPIWEEIFHKMIVESRISAKYIPDMNDERRSEMRRLREENPRMDRSVWVELDSTLCEKYFAMTRDDNPEKFNKDVAVYLDKGLIPVASPDRPFTKAENITYQMCLEIDSVKEKYIGNNKPCEKILFSDYEKMYRGMSEVIIKYYTRYGINLVPLDEYLTMSCWMSQKGSRKEVQTVLAFPSKYSTDEIGFYSQDEAFSQYITTMLEGVRQSQRNNNQ